MGFNEYIVPGRGSQEPSNNGTNQKKALEQNAVNHMLQCLAQLVDVRQYATEIFTNLQAKAEEAGARMKTVKKRVEELSAQVDPIDDQFHKTSPQCFYEAYATKRFQSETTPPYGLFIRRGAPEPVNRRRNDAQPVPELEKLDRYEKCLDVDESKQLHCLDQYTYPRFFLDQWLKAQREKMSRKKKRKKKKKKRKRTDQPKKVTAFHKTYKDDLGREIVRKQQTVDVTVADRELQRGAAMSTVNKSYGTSTNLTAYQDNRTATGSVYQPAAYDKKNVQQYQGEAHQASRPPPVQPGSAPPQIAAPPPVRGPPPGPGGPPPGPGAPPPGPGAPPAHRAPPQQPAYQQPAHQPPAVPQRPAILDKYVKFQKMGVPPPGIKNKMRADGVDPNLYDLWLDPDGPKGATASGPPSGPGGPPPGPGSPPPGPGAPPPGPASAPPPGPRGGTGNLMAAIRTGTNLQKAQPRKAPLPARGGGLLDAIRQGTSLKSADDRVLADRPKETNKREVLLENLRSGITLKKASNRKLKEKKEEPVEDSNNIFALLKLREMVEESDDESDESGSWDS